MLDKRILALCLSLLFFIFVNCGEKKDTTTTTTGTTKDGDKTKTVDTVKSNQQSTTQTEAQTQNQSQLKDTSMQSNQTAGKDPAGNNKSVKDDSDGDIVKMETTMGTIKIKLYTDKAPITAGNFKKLVQEGFYNGIIFHRVIDGFMIQGGDPTGTGTGGSKETIKDEFGPGLKHSKKGILSMANRGPNTGTSQFFITLAPTPHLDGKHAIFGEVIEGMDVVEKIGKTKVGPADKPVTDVKMKKVTMTDK